jgi:hypothetical protein
MTRSKFVTKPRRPRPADQVMFTIQLSSRAKMRLKALSDVERDHAYALVEKAFWEYWERLPERKRRTAELLAATMESYAAEVAPADTASELSEPTED